MYVLYSINSTFFFLFIIFTFEPNLYLVGGFTLNELLNKPWSQVSTLLPPRYVIYTVGGTQ